MFLSPFVTRTWFKMWWIKHAQKVPSTKPFMSNGALFTLSPLPPPTSSLMHFTKYWNIETSAHFQKGHDFFLTAVSSPRTNSALRDGGSAEPFISRSTLSMSLTGFFGIDVSEIFYLFLNGREESANLFLP